MAPLLMMKNESVNSSSCPSKRSGEMEEFLRRIAHAIALALLKLLKLIAIAFPNSFQYEIDQLGSSSQRFSSNTGFNYPCPLSRDLQRTQA
jgi:hypothetical protein